MPKQFGSIMFPDDVTDEEIAQVLLRQQGTLAIPPAGETEFERTSPDVAASRAAQQRLEHAQTGETVARGVRDAAALTLATLLTRGAGGGAFPQALSRIGTSGVMSAAETPGGLAKRA